MIEEIKRDDSEDYLKILKGLLELPFPVGKNLLADFLRGDYKNKSITKNRLEELNNFDTLSWEKERILQEIESLIKNGMIETSNSGYNSFAKLLKLTLKGCNEITHPTLAKKKLKNNFSFKETKISEEDRLKFLEFEDFLERYNDEQKKAIVSEAKNILCVAGAGSGKTTVLTKRIEFLVKYKNVLPEKILAITFTRKAKKEMERRLNSLGIEDVNVHTFNSFCENILRENIMKVYGRFTKVQNYGDKILAMNMALASLGIDMQGAIENYFTMQQRKFKTGNQLANIFMNDCFSVLDYFKINGGKIEDFSKGATGKDLRNAQMIYKIVRFLDEHMKIQGLRDFTDQLVDAMNFLKKNPSQIPRFEYILIDEYQDVNAMQIELLKLLNPKNVFAVGDPRQAIFGWRGSDIKYILDFEKEYETAEVICLIKNYRSAKEVVDFMNFAVKNMGLPDLIHHRENKDVKIKILDFDSEDAERNFVVRKILSSEVPRKEIFVLARTNRQLSELSQKMKMSNIPHVVKTDEIKNPVDASEGDVTLATIHAIKGLEAKKVFVMGCNEQNFPCKASDHPAVEMLKKDNYDKEEEERRLFYVAISRAKDILYLTYSGKKATYFITDEMKNLDR